MFRRIAVFAALLAFAAPLARAAERRGEVSYDDVRESIVRIAPRVELTQLFERFAEGGPSFEAADGVSSPATTTEVLVARIGTDGKPILGCVDNEHSAHRFLGATIERLQARRAQDQ